MEWPLARGFESDLWVTVNQRTLRESSDSKRS